jgi:hypothetical protein
MPAAIPEYKRNRIKVQLGLSVPSKVIAKETHVAHRTIQRYKKNIKEYGQVRPPKADVQGRPRKITAEMEEVCPHNSVFDIQNLTIRHFLIILRLDLLCTLMNKSTICGICLMSVYQNNVSNACSNVPNGQKRRYYALAVNYRFFDILDAITCCTTESRAQKEVD